LITDIGDGAEEIKRVHQGRIVRPTGGDQSIANGKERRDTRVIGVGKRGSRLILSGEERATLGKREGKEKGRTETRIKNIQKQVVDLHYREKGKATSSRNLKLNPGGTAAGYC